jgi:TRAP-type C4-dicarboxylate transport system permease small subunit
MYGGAMSVSKQHLLKKGGQTVLDIIEIYLPSLTFTTLFIVFLIQIFYRYFIVPLTWPMELSLFCYLWTILFGVCYAQRDNEHISFSLVYDQVKPKGQLIMRIIANTLLVTSFSIALYPSYKYVNFMGFKKSNVLLIPMNWAYFPFVIMMVILIFRFAIQLVKDLKLLFRGEV